MKIRYIFCQIIIFYVLAVIPGVELNAGERGYVPKMGRTLRPDMMVVAEEDRGGYVCQLIEYSVDDSYTDCNGRRIKDSERVRGYLLVPDVARKGKCPALVMQHDHGARFDIGKEKLVRPILSALPFDADDHIYISSQQWVHKYFDGVYLADSLAANGYVVLVSDAYYWGDRASDQAHRWSELTYGSAEQYSVPSDCALDKSSRKDLQKSLKNDVYQGQTAVYNDLRKKGIIWAEKILRDDIAAAGLVAGLPYVDKRRVGAFGFSMGAHRCWLLAAFCRQVKYGVAVSWMTTLEDYDSNNPSDLSMRIQPLRDYLDFGDIGMYLSPKPMLFLNGDTDPLFPKESVQTAFEKLHYHYDACRKKSEKSVVCTQFFSGGHHCGKTVQQILLNYLATREAMK